MLYVDDVAKLFSSSVLCKLYADDVKLYSVIQTEQDASELQSSLDALVAWSNGPINGNSPPAKNQQCYASVKHTLTSAM